MEGDYSSLILVVTLNKEAWFRRAKYGSHIDSFRNYHIAVGWSSCRRSGRLLILRSRLTFVISLFTDLHSDRKRLFFVLKCVREDYFLSNGRISKAK